MEEASRLLRPILARAEPAQVSVRSRSAAWRQPAECADDREAVKLKGPEGELKHNAKEVVPGGREPQV